jgi:prepilin-type N-terminal cleavage/methylation domain-containing protein/prepilin-type processing-associated H-X9-DG protein
MSRTRTIILKGGFSLIELLVVVMIIGVLIALILPALAASREASRRAQCANNLRQIGIALLSYESAHGSFPLGGIARLVGTAPELNGWTNSDGLGFTNGLSWRALILPQLDQNPLFNNFNFGVPVDGGAPDKGAGFTFWMTSLAVFVCPSDSGHEDGFRSSNADDSNFGQWPQGGTPPIDPATGSSASQAAVKSYDGSFGDNYSVTTLLASSPWETPCGAELPRGQTRIGWPGFWGTTYGCDEAAGRNQGGTLRGIFDYRTGQFTRLRSVTDGTSSTIIVGEGLSAQRADSTLWDANSATAGTAIPMNLLTDRAPCSDGIMWTTLDVGCRFSFASAGFKSEHPGGVNFLFCDGSVRFVKETIARSTYAALGSKAGGEALTAESF